MSRTEEPSITKICFPSGVVAAYPNPPPTCSAEAAGAAIANRHEAAAVKKSRTADDLRITEVSTVSDYPTATYNFITVIKDRGLARSDRTLRLVEYYPRPGVG